MTSPGPEDVAEAIRQGRPPSSLLADADGSDGPADEGDRPDGDRPGDDEHPGDRRP